MPYTNFNKSADHPTFISGSRWRNRHPIITGFFLTRVARAQNDYLQLQYNSLYTENLSELRSEISITPRTLLSGNAENTTADIIRILFQPHLNYFPSESNTATENKRLLIEIPHWYTPEDLNSKPLVSQQNITKLEHWKRISQNSNSDSFSQFLSKLRACNVVTHSSGFKQHIRAFLDNIMLSPSLAETLFAIALDGTTSCNDKTLFTYNQMQQVMIIDDINKGKYDTQLDALITVARRVYRTRQLTMIANQHMKHHPNTDEI